MSLLKNRNIFVICLILLFIDKISALKCWSCTSVAINSKFCGETLDRTLMNEQQIRLRHVECIEKPYGFNTENLIPKCRILIQLVHEVPTYIRSCFWEQENIPANSCAIQNHSPYYVKTVACNTCVEDRCNDKLLSVSEKKDNETESANDVNNAAVLAVLSSVSEEKDNKTKCVNNSADLDVLSNAIFVVFIISTVIRY